MEKLTLSDEQRDKLLKMAIDLFTEHKEASIVFADDEFYVVFGNPSYKIHWFEFCVVELPERIAESSNTVYPKEKHAFIVDVMMKRMLNFSPMEKKHPVDYLYEAYGKTEKQ